MKTFAALPAEARRELRRRGLSLREPMPEAWAWFDGAFRQLWQGLGADHHRELDELVRRLDGGTPTPRDAELLQAVGAGIPPGAMSVDEFVRTVAHVRDLY